MQPDLQRRERVVTEFRSRRKTPNGEFPNIHDLESTCDRATKAVLRALSGAARSDRTSDSLVAAYASLDRLVASWQNLLPRPQRNRGRIIGNALQRYSEAAEQFLEALIAPDMITAQEYERQGNQFFKEAANKLAALKQLDEVDEVFAESSPADSLNSIGRAARQLAGQESSLDELDRALRSGVGWESASEGMGLQAHAIQSLALSSFDLESFTQVLRASDAAAGLAGKKFVHSKEWKQRHARAAAFLGSAVASVHQAIFTAGGSDFEIVHRAVEAIATLRDGVLRHALATIMASSREQYLRLARKNAGAVIGKAASSIPALLLDENLTKALRDAGAHADIDLSETAVRIDDVHFSMDHFIDRFLAYLETTVATFVGVVLATARLGVEFEYNDYLAPRDRDAAVALFLGAFDLRSESVDVLDNDLIIYAQGPEPDWMPLAAALSVMYPNSITRATIRVVTRATEHSFVTSLDRFRTYTDGIETLGAKQSILGIIAIAAASRLDGDSPLSEDEWDRAAGAIIDREEGDDLRAWVRNVRALRGYAREAENAHVASACVRALADLRR
ncbi:hypothetical protein [Spelaeicoccus albus]|uniref:Uncharacterized protein n=1 Tax=Spelaeicoccus albus TaxID=1280376 RepID=A0A7Z0A9J8_9MICO|nr:hypothetical protein [Spelaeicoccus albus]NYI66093.1 hypothetical protein [Spelaeicoccus albus]